MDLISEFNGFFKCHLRLVYAMALSRGAGESEVGDLVQETFLRAWRHYHKLSTLEPLAQRAWLIRTLRNLAIDSWRRCREGPESLELHQEPAILPPPSLLRLDVARALSVLEERDREIIILRYFLDLNSREIGEVLDLPDGTVRRRLMECRQQLAVLLVQWKPEEVCR